MGKYPDEDAIDRIEWVYYRDWITFSFLAVGVALLLSGLLWRTYEPLWIIGSAAGLWVGIQRTVMKHIGKNIQRQYDARNSVWCKYDGWMSGSRVSGIVARILPGTAFMVAGTLWDPPQFHPIPPNAQTTWPEIRTWLVSVLPTAFLFIGSALAMWGISLVIRKIARGY